MADSENIGSISVSITGDYSDLIAAFQEAVQLAADSGKRIADALSSAASSPDMSGITDALATINADTQSTADAIRSGLNDALQSAFTAPDTSGVTDAVAAVGQVADTVTQQLSLFDAAVHTPYEDAAGQLNLFSTALEPISGGASKAEEAIRALNEADAASVQAFDDLMASANAAATAADNYSGSVADVMNRQKDANEALEQARGTVEALKAMVDEGTASEDDLARAERDLEKATRDASGAVRESGDAAHEAHGHIAELLESLLAFGGIEVTLGALKEFATEASEISAHAERIRGALGLMTGSAQTAAEMMEHLKDVSQELSVPIESLETMSRKLVAAGADVSSVDKAVRAAADAAAATGNDFDTIASKIAQIGLTGVVSAKNLKDLGLNTKDMADVMNTSVEDVKKTLVAEDIGGVIETLSETVSKKFPGAAKEMADDTQGQLTRVSNQWHDLKEQVGDAINPILVELLPKLGDGLKGLIGVGAVVVTGLKEVIDVIVGLASASGAALDGFVSAIGHITAGDFKGAVQALKDGFDNTKAASQATWAALTKDVSDGVGTITKLYGDQAKAAGESADKQEGASKQTAAAAAAAAAAAIAAGEEFKKEQKAAEEFASSALEFLHKIPASYEEYLRKLSDGGATAEASIKQLQTLLDKATETASKMSGAPLAEMQQYIDKLTKLKDTLRQFADSDAFTKLEDHFNTLQAKFPELGQAAYDTFLKIVDELSAIPGALAKATPELIRMQDAVVEAQAKLEEQAGKTQAAFDKVWLKFLEDGQNKVQPITVDIRARLDQMGTDGSRAVLAVADAMHETGIKAGEAQVQTSTFIAALETISTKSRNIALADEEFGKVASRIQSLTDKDIPNLIKATEDYKNDVVKSGLIIGDQLTREEAATRLQITALEEAGKNATEYKIKLQDLEREHENVRNSASVWDDIRVKLDATKTSVGELKDRIAGDFVKGYQTAFKGFSDGLVDLAFDGGKFGDKMEGIFKNIAKSILTDLIDAALTPLKNMLSDMLSGVIKNFTGGLQNLTGLASQAGGTAISTAGSLGQLGSAASTAAGGVGAAGGAAGGLSGALGTATSSVAGWMGAIGSVVGAVAGIGQFIQGFSMSSDLGHIEENTRVAAIHLRDYLNQAIYDKLDHIGDGTWYSTEHLVNIENVINDLNSAFHVAYGMTADATTTATSLSDTLRAAIKDLGTTLSTVFTAGTDTGAAGGPVTGMQLWQQMTDKLFEIADNTAWALKDLDMIVGGLGTGSQAQPAQRTPTTPPAAVAGATPNTPASGASGTGTSGTGSGGTPPASTPAPSAPVPLPLSQYAEQAAKQEKAIIDLTKEIGDLPQQMKTAQEAGNFDLAYQISVKLQPLEFALHEANNALFTAQSQQTAFKETYGTPSTAADFDRIISSIKPQLQYAIDHGNQSLIDQLNAQLSSLNQQRDAVIATKADTSSTSTHTGDTAKSTADTAKNTDPPVSTKPVTDQVKLLDASIRDEQEALRAAQVSGSQGQIAALTESLHVLVSQRDVLVNSEAYAKENSTNTGDTAKNTGSTAGSTDVTAKNTTTANVGIEAQLIAQRGIQDSAAKTQANTGDAAKSVHDTADGVRQMQDPTAKTAANTSASGPISSAVVEVHALIAQTQADLTGAVTRGDTAQVAALTIQLAALQALGTSVDTVATATGDNTSVLQTIPDQIAMAMKGANDAVIGGLLAIAAAIAAIQPSVTNNYYSTSNYSSVQSTVITNQNTSPPAAAASNSSTASNADNSSVGHGSGAAGGRGFDIGGYDPTGGWRLLHAGEYVLTPEQVTAVSPKPLTSLHEQMDILSIAKMAGERSFDVGGYDPTGGWRLQHPGEYVLTAGEVSQLPIAPLTSLHQKMDLSALMPAAPSASELRGLAVSPPPAMGQQMDFSSQSGHSGSGGGITINNLSLPGVKNVREFVKEMQDLYKQLSPKTHILSA